VLSSDCFAAFEELGDVIDPSQGRRFLETILSVGGSRPAMESFIAFRGRPPSIDPLLRHNGIAS
jgi:oligopeptidase A